MTLALGLGLGLPFTRSTGVSFDLAAFMAEQSDGFTFDFAAYDRQFQENTGPTPADEANEVIGLALEDRTWDGQTLAQVMAGQAEVLTNGQIGTGTGWTFSGSPNNWSISGGAIVGSSSGTFSRIDHMAHSAFVEGAMYQVAMEVARTSGTFNVYIGGEGGDLVPISTGGTVVVYLRCATGTIGFRLGSSNFVGSIDNVSVKEVPAHYALQASSNFKPKVQATGAKFDGSDDFQITDYSLSGATEVFAFDWVDIPAEIAATQIMFGGQNAGGEAFYLAVLTDGALRLKIGSTSIDSTGVDIRGGQHVVGAYTNGTTAYLMVDAVVVGSDTYSGSLPATAWYLGAVNNNGSAAAFFGGSLLIPHTGREAITEARARQISTALAA